MTIFILSHFHKISGQRVPYLFNNWLYHLVSRENRNYQMEWVISKYHIIRALKLTLIHILLFFASFPPPPSLVPLLIIYILALLLYCLLSLSPLSPPYVTLPIASSHEHRHTFNLNNHLKKKTNNKSVVQKKWWQLLQKSPPNLTIWVLYTIKFAFLSWQGSVQWSSTWGLSILCLFYLVGPGRTAFYPLQLDSREENDCKESHGSI